MAKPESGHDEMCEPCSEPGRMEVCAARKAAAHKAYNAPTRSYINLNIQVKPYMLQALTDARRTFDMTCGAILTIIACKLPVASTTFMQRWNTAKNADLNSPPLSAAR